MRILDAEGALLREPLGGVPEVYVGVQGGLLDIELSPQFESDRSVFLTYACGSKKANNTCVGRSELRGGRLENFRRIFQAEGVNYPGTNITPHKALEDVQGPINHWTPSIAPSGITVYRGDAFPEFNGDLLVSGLTGQGVFHLDLEDGRMVADQRLFHELGKRIRDVVVGDEGELYLLTDHNPGRLLRIDALDPERPAR